MNGLSAFEKAIPNDRSLAMIAQSVADILSHHVNCGGGDRPDVTSHLVPKLQHEQGLCGSGEHTVDSCLCHAAAA